MRRVFVLILVPIVCWSAGLVWFVSHLDDPPMDPARPVDAIVVLTGGSLRIDTGLQLLVAHNGRKLFVSGVHPGIDARDVLRLTRGAPSWVRCCVVLGHESFNTIGNAIETAAWLRGQGYHSIRLVTANYHMRRSLLEFSRVLPPNIEILTYPVFPEAGRQDPSGRWRGTVRVIVVEYTKFLGAWVRAALVGRVPGFTASIISNGALS